MSVSTEEDVEQYQSALAQLEMGVKRFYLHEQKLDYSGDTCVVLEEAYYGPFAEDEIVERANDRLGDLIAESSGNLDSVEMTDAEASKYYINSREFWMSQLAELSE